MPLLSALILTGCSSEPQRYDDISTLASAVDTADVECDATEPGPQASLVSDSAVCDGSGVTLFLYETAQDLEDWSKVGARLGPALIGPNWAITGEADDLDRISSETGGEIVNGN